MDDERGHELHASGMRGRGEGRAFTVMGDSVVLKAAAPDQAHAVFEVTTRAPLGPPPRRDIDSVNEASRQFGVRRPDP